MGQKAKFIIVGLVGLLIICLFLFIQTLNSKQQLMRERDDLKMQNEQLQRDKSVLELDLNNLRRENDDIKRQLEYNKKVMDSLAQELVREKNDKIQIQDSFKSIRNENFILVRQLKSLNMRKIDLDKKLKQLQEEKASLERKLSEMETVLTGAAEIVAPFKTKESVELPPIVVRPQVETQIQEPADFLGKILTVDRENNFTIIDLGQEAGVRIGDTFGVYREGKKIANIEVIKIGKSVAACDITRETTPIEIDDTIK